jgi:excisionase family DNA binding protein
MTVTIAPETVLPPDDPGELETLNALLPELPERLRKGLAAFVDALSRGEAVRVEPVAAMLTTSQAAEVLGVSRMTLVKLLEEGRIPYEQPSVHRMVRLADVLTYKDGRSKRRAAYLEDSMRQAEEYGLIQEDINNYTAALKRARSRRRA